MLCTVAGYIWTALETVTFVNISKLLIMTVCQPGASNYKQYMCYFHGNSTKFPEKAFHDDKIVLDSL
jgi:hypothetical protein